MVMDMKHLQALKFGCLLALGKDIKQNHKPNNNVDSIILDVVGLSSVPNKNLDKLKSLEIRGVLIDIMEDKTKTDFRVTTPDSVNELRTLAQVDADGFHARSYAVHSVDNKNITNPNPDTIRMAFGGTVKLGDVPRTFAMHVTKWPFLNEKLTNVFLDETLKSYEDSYGRKPFSEELTISAHSAGSTHAIKAFDLLNKKVPNLNAKLRLYEPFGAKFVDFDHGKHGKTVSYHSPKSFLNKMDVDGHHVGSKEILPVSSSQELCSSEGVLGSMISEIYAHTLLCVLDGTLEFKANQTESSSRGR